MIRERIVKVMDWRYDPPERWIRVREATRPDDDDKSDPEEPQSDR